jgi:chromosome partitioning protein
MLAIGVLNAKGGVGKTLIATMLAVRASLDFPRVALVDLDPQRGAERWRMHRRASIKSDNPTVFADGLLASDAMDRLHQTGWDIAIFDGAPGAMELTEDAIKTVDLVVCPLRAADQDLGSTEYLVSACLDFHKPLLLVINSVNPRGDKRADEVRSLLVKTGHHVAANNIAQRVPYVDAMNVGKSAAELKTGAEARNEIESLYLEVISAARASKASVGKKERSYG